MIGLKRLLGLRTPPEDKNDADVLSNNDLYNELILCFTQKLQQMSFGKRMLFPTSFNVLLHPDDFEKIVKALPFIVMDSVSSFYEVIKNNRERYANYDPPASWWHFQFSPAERSPFDDEILKHKDVIVVAELYDVAINSSRDASGSAKSVVVTCRKNNSKVYADKTINLDIFKNIEVVARGVFHIRFDSGLNTLTTAPSSQGEAFYATLAYSVGDARKLFRMTSLEIRISGSAGDPNDASALILPDDNIINNHVWIKYNVAARKFYIAAYGPVKLAGAELELSRGGNPNWYELPPRNSSILLNDLFNIDFNAREDLFF